MALPTPNLDDRRFQGLVDDAKRLVQQRCPTWTDHNVSDPGVTLIETFAYMTDLLLYRLNRVPDRNYLRFLELIGIRLFPPTAARVPVTFWLAAPQPSTLSVPARTVVAAKRGDQAGPAVSFSTLQNLDIVSARLSRIESISEEGVRRDHTERLGVSGFSAFTAQPQPGDTMLLGLSEAVPSCAVLLRFDCEVEGVGVDPANPPLRWEAWGGETWVPCEVDHDDTGGLNRAGDIVLHVPATHVVSLQHQRRAGWLRCRVIEPAESQRFYSSSPRVNSLSASVIGGTVEAENAHVVAEEVIGISEGVPGQRFALSESPVVPSVDPVLLEVSAGEGWDVWSEVDSFAERGEEDRCFILDRSAGEVVLGPAVRQPDGTMQYYGAVPPKGAVLRIRNYHTGGGRGGNVARGALSVLKSSIPFIDGVTNRVAASGGVDGEDIEAAKIRGPIMLRTLGRAVTPEDYEQLAREAAPEVARVRCVAAATAEEGGVARVLVVPAVGGEHWQLSFAELLPAEDTLRRIASYLDQRRTIGARVVVEPPAYQGVTVVAELRARPGADPGRLAADASAALYRYLHPLEGGPDGTGWPFGRPAHIGEIYAVLQRVPGTELVETARLFTADPLTGERGPAVQRVELDPNTLLFSFEHQIRVEGG